MCNVCYSTALHFSHLRLSSARPASPSALSKYRGNDTVAMYKGPTPSASLRILSHIIIQSFVAAVSPSSLDAASDGSIALQPPPSLVDPSLSHVLLPTAAASRGQYSLIGSSPSIHRSIRCHSPLDPSPFVARSPSPSSPLHPCSRRQHQVLVLFAPEARRRCPHRRSIRSIGSSRSLSVISKLPSPSI
jgi:hypothetical protein